MRTATSYKVAIAACVITLAGLIATAAWLIANAPRQPRARTAPKQYVLGAAIAPRVEAPLPEAKPRLWFSWSAPQPQPAPKHSVYGPIIAAEAAKHAVSPKLVEAVVKVESDFDPLVVSHKGARGLMQVMPRTGERFGVKRDDLFVPRHNIAAGTAYLAWLLRRYKDVDLALAAYNAGEGAVDRYRGIPPYKETREYVKRVRNALRRAG